MLTLVPCPRFGGVPKWLKGPDSKSGRPALPVQEFESLHLRHVGASFKSERAHAAAPPFQIEPASLGFDLGVGANLEATASILLGCAASEQALYRLLRFLFFAQDISLPAPYPAGFSCKKSGDFSPAFVIAPTAYMTRCRPLPSPQRAAPRSPAPAG